MICASFFSLIEKGENNGTYLIWLVFEVKVNMCMCEYIMYIYVNIYVYVLYRFHAKSGIYQTLGKCLLLIISAMTCAFRVKLFLRELEI